jgi:hypothetical protein
MSRRETQPTISDVRLERYRLGELLPEDQQAVAACLAADPALGERLAGLERSDRDIAAAYPAQEMAEAVRRRARESVQAPARRDGRRRAWLVPASVVATCVCLMAVAGSWLLRPAREDTTMKGGGDASLVLHRRVADGSEELARGTLVRQGEQVRIGYRASGRAYGAILSIDGRGNLTQHLPSTGERAAGLQAAGTVFLDFAYELDDAPRWEVFYFVTADAPFELEPVRRAVRAAAASRDRSPGALALPRGLSQFLFPLTKDQR